MEEGAGARGSCPRELPTYCLTVAGRRARGRRRCVLPLSLVPLSSFGPHSPFSPAPPSPSLQLLSLFLSPPLAPNLSLPLARSLARSLALTLANVCT